MIVSAAIAASATEISFVLPVIVTSLSPKRDTRDKRTPQPSPGARRLAPFTVGPRAEQAASGSLCYATSGGGVPVSAIGLFGQLLVDFGGYS